jgi:flagellar hook protein FlgE
MSSISAIALSGMSASQASLSSAAHNIANLSTPGFRRQQVSQASVDGGGVTTSVSRTPALGNELERDIVGQMAAKNSFLANLAVFRTSDSMMGTLLNMQA